MEGDKGLRFALILLQALYVCSGCETTTNGNRQREGAN